MQTITKEAIKKIQQQTNHVLVVSDLDDIERLDRVANDVSKSNPIDRRILKTPHVLCGINFYPITVAKALWHQEVSLDWEIDENYQDAFMFWLLSLPLTADALEAHSDYKVANKACRRLARKLQCSPTELGEVYDKCIPSHGQSDDGEGADEDHEARYGAMMAVMLREYGGKPEDWLYETPVDLISDLYAELLAKHNDDAAGEGVKSKKAYAPRASAKISALSAFRNEVNRLTEKWSVTDG